MEMIKWTHIILWINLCYSQDGLDNGRTMILRKINHKILQISHFAVSLAIALLVSAADRPKSLSDIT